MGELTGRKSLPGCYPKLADRQLLDLLSDQPIVSVKAAEAELAEARVECVTVNKWVGGDDEC